MQSWLALLMLAYSGKKVPRMWRSFESSSVTGLYQVRKSLCKSIELLQAEAVYDKTVTVSGVSL